MDKSWEHQANINRTSREHPITSMNTWKHLWTSEIIWTHLEHLWASESILRTSKNNKYTYRTCENTWNHPENNWGALIVSLIQFEADFNIHTKKLRDRIGWLSQTRSILRSPHKWVLTTIFLPNKKSKDCVLAKLSDLMWGFQICKFFKSRP